MDRVHKSALQGKAKKLDENVLLSHFQAAKGKEGWVQLVNVAELFD